MDPKDLIEIFSKLITMIATISAGGWAYYRFVKGRVFKPRLTLSASARRFYSEGTEYVLSTVELSNVGLTKIDIDKATLRICSLSGKAAEKIASVPKRVCLDTCQVLLAHSWVEPGKVLREENLHILPANLRSPISLDFKVVAQGVSIATNVIAPASEREASTA